MQPKAILTLIYYVIMIVTLLVGMIGHNLAVTRGIGLDPESSLSTTLHSLVILYVIASIPYALWQFHKKLKGMYAIPNNGNREAYYVRYASIRLILVGVGLVISILAYFLLQQPSLIWLGGMAAIALIFCRPNGARIDADIEGEVEIIEEEKEKTEQ